MFKSSAPAASVSESISVQCTAARWSSKSLLIVASVLCLSAATALLADIPVARHLQNERLPGELRRIIRLAEAFGYGGTVALIIATAAALDPRGWRVAWRLAAGAYGAGLVANSVKLLVARTRPSAANLDAGSLESFAGWLPPLNRQLPATYNYALQSFPSAHTATAVGLAVSLAALYPRGRWLFAVCAALCGIQRLESQAHFLSDVLAGAALGCLVGATVQWAFDPRNVEFKPVPYATRSIETA